MKKMPVMNMASNYMGRKSHRLLLISLIVLAFLTINGTFTYYHAKSTTSDSKVINYTGIIRGSIQRITKLELAGLGNDQLIEYLDNVINDFYTGEMMIKGNNEQFKRQISSLKVDWESFKSLIHIYRENSDSTNQNIIVQASENLWEKANTTVFTAEMLSVKKMKFYDYATAVSLVNLVLMSIIILIIKSYVRDKLEFHANYDTLTKIYNRRFLYEYLNETIDNSKRFDKELAVMLFDIDHFKSINDNFGHDKGDYVLVELSKIISGSIRKNDVFARIGGDEFVIIFPELSIEEIRILAERLRKAVEEHTFGTVGKITISTGISKYTKDDILDSILKRADVALYDSKSRGRNRVTIVA